MPLYAHQIHKISQLIERLLGKTNEYMLYIKISVKDVEVTLTCVWKICDEFSE
jgi:hypothetical protein